MTVVPVPLLLAAFRDEGEAGEALAQLEARYGEPPCGIVDAATLSKDGSGLLGVTSARRRDARGLYVGGVVGTFIGGLAGPAMATAARRGVLGGLRGRLQSAPLKFELLAIGEELLPHASLLIAVVERGWAERLNSELHALATSVLTYELRPSVVDQCTSGGDVAFLFADDHALHAGAGPRDALDGAGRLGVPLHSQGAVAVSAVTLIDERAEQRA